MTDLQGLQGHQTISPFRSILDEHDGEAVTDLFPERLQRKIAEVQGWCQLEVRPDGRLWGYIRGSGMEHPLDNLLAPVPNWPTSLDIARELPIGKNNYQRAKFAASLSRITGGSRKIIFHTAEQWCLAWLLYKGWRWVKCEVCGDTGEVVGEAGQSPIPPNIIHHALVECETCSGAGGKWVRVRGGRR